MRTMDEKTAKELRELLFYCYDAEVNNFFQDLEQYLTPEDPDIEALERMDNEQFEKWMMSKPDINHIFYSVVYLQNWLDGKIPVEQGEGYAEKTS